MIYIVDDFYHNPDEIRKQALKLKYVEGITADKRRGHTGERAKNPNNSNMVYLRNKFQAVTGKKIVEFKYDTSNGAFNLGYKKEHFFNWIHGDHTIDRGFDHQFWAAVIYLTPNPPRKSGTVLVEDVESKSMKQYQKEAVTKGPAFKNNYFDGANTLWKPHLVVENKYNRCLIYDGTYFHAPTVSSFGNNKETGRLTQIGFWLSEK